VTLHAGRMLTCDEVSIGPPNACAIWRAEGHAEEDPFEPVGCWYSWARAREDAYYFAIYQRVEAVGQIFLHDVDPQAATALVGYHLFEAQTRGKGVGTRALRLLQEYVVEETDLRRLVIITTRDNVPSRRVAEKCGFEYVGPQRERPGVGLCYAWDVSPKRVAPVLCARP
jgi:RimJ/RimL family protein N-acetyltransferase